MYQEDTYLLAPGLKETGYFANGQSVQGKTYRVRHILGQSVSVENRFCLTRFCFYHIYTLVAL